MRTILQDHILFPLCTAQNVTLPKQQATYTKQGDQITDIGRGRP